MASSIMTTDTKPKLAYEEIIIGDELNKNLQELQKDQE